MQNLREDKPLHIDPMTWRHLGEHEFQRPHRLSASAATFIVGGLLLVAGVVLVWMAGQG